MKWIVTATESGSKLLAFLKVKLGEGYSAKMIKRAIESNQCEVNGRVERFASTLVGTGDRILLHLPQNQTNAAPKIEKPTILYEDQDLQIFNKPAGIESESPELAKIGGFLTHRLDKETTGVLIFAKSKAVRDLMFALFRQHKIEKCYLAIVDGVPNKTSGVVENALGKLHEYQGQTLWGAVDKEKGLYAYTRWELEKSGSNASLLRCYPKTGRTHQIRVHLSGMGHPVLGDHQYGRRFTCPYRPGRYLLHAFSVSFTHPTTQREITVEAGLPKDFQEALKQIHCSR